MEQASVAKLSAQHETQWNKLMCSMEHINALLKSQPDFGKLLEQIFTQQITLLLLLL